MTLQSPFYTLHPFHPTAPASAPTPALRPQPRLSDPSLSLRPQASGPSPIRTHLGQLIDLVGVQVELLQGLLQAEDLLGHSLQAAVGVVQRRHCLLLPPQAAARHQTHKQVPLARHPQALQREESQVSRQLSELLVHLGAKATRANFLRQERNVRGRVSD